VAVASAGPYASLVCTSLQTDNHASTPPLSFFTGRVPFLPPNQQCQSTMYHHTLLKTGKMTCFHIKSKHNQNQRQASWRMPLPRRMHIHTDGQAKNIMPRGPSTGRAQLNHIATCHHSCVQIHKREQKLRKITEATNYSKHISSEPVTTLYLNLSSCSFNFLHFREDQTLFSNILKKYKTRYL